MSNLCQELASFIVETRYEALPSPVVHETKRLLLDSVGCALGGVTTDPGKMAISLAKRLGGPPESSIVGTGEKVSCTSATFANGQLINALDYDAFTPGSHTPAYVIPPALAMAESTCASGKELILAMALGFEMTARISAALTGYIRFEGPEKKIKRADRQGYASFNFGAAAAVGKLLNLDRDKMAHALGIAGHLCQVLTWIRQGFTETRPMTKYGVPGWQDTGGVMAALLAEMGYMGDTTLFDDPEQGFWKFAGYAAWNPEKVLLDIGKSWNFVKASYKPYPCCRQFHSALDCFFNIINKNNLTPADIESVRVWGHPDFEIPVFTNRSLTNIVDIQFGLPYVFSMAAHRVTIGPEWQDWDTATSPKIVEFAKKVSYQAHPEFGKTQPALVEVVAGGKTFREEKSYALSRGTWGTDFQMTDKELEEKYRHNASRILTQDKIDGSLKAISELESVKTAAELMKQLTI